MGVLERLSPSWSGPENKVYSTIVTRSRRRAWLLWGVAAAVVFVGLLASSPAASLALGTIVVVALLVAADQAPWLLIPGRLGTALRAYHWVSVDMQLRAEDAFGPGASRSPGDIRRRATGLKDPATARRALASAACLEMNWQEAIEMLSEPLANESALERFLDLTLIHRAAFATGHSPALAIISEHTYRSIRRLARETHGRS